MSVLRGQWGVRELFKIAKWLAIESESVSDSVTSDSLQPCEM